MSSMGETLYNTVARSMRSVFIGNLPLDTTEEQLKEICSEIGPLINVKIFTDNDSNKPKVYGFCEYKDKEMAQSAVRNLDGYLLRNSPLRVHIASSEKSKEEMESLQGLVTEQGETSTDATSEKAPEEISKAVASLPAEQMFELMKQMKMCIENNPTEARNLLLQNPQLAYALLQAQVIMRIVDPEVALQILNRPPLSVQVPTSSAPENKIPTETVPQMAPPVNETPSAFPAFSPAVTQLSSSAASAPRAPANPPLRPLLHGDRVPVMAASAVPPMPSPFADRDMRIMGDRDMRQLPIGDRDMRQLPILSGDKDIRQSVADQDYRTLVNNRPFDPRFRNMQGSDNAGSRVSSFDRMRTGANSDPRTAFEGRVSAAARVEDPRKALSAASVNSRAGIVSASPATVVSSSSTTQPVHHSVAAPTPASSALAPQDQEKAALIMQVLQLSDQQIAMLPPEQRQSILVLKEQIARSQIS